MHPAFLIDRLGRVAERRQLIEQGCSPSRIAGALHRGEIHRVRRAWFSTDGASEEQLVAIRVGGVLGGVSAARSYGIWVPEGTAIHVSLASNASRLRPSAIEGRALVLDWTRDRLPIRSDREAWRVAADLALRQAFRVIGDDEAVAMADSALRGGVVDRVAVERELSRRRPELVPLLDARAESGVESLVRFRLASRGIRTRPQFVIPGVGRVDLLVGDRLVVEVDGAAFHGPDRFEADRVRDLELAARDLRCLRLSYGQVVREWASTEDVILRLLDRGEHRSPPRTFFRTDARHTATKQASDGESPVSP